MGGMDPLGDIIGTSAGPVHIEEKNCQILKFTSVCYKVCQTFLFYKHLKKKKGKTKDQNECK